MFRHRRALFLCYAFFVDYSSLFMTDFDFDDQDLIDEETEYTNETEYTTTQDTNSLSKKNSQSHSDNFALTSPDAILNSSATNLQTWKHRNGGAISESEKEFHIFNLYLNSGCGRSNSYIAATFNLSESRVGNIAKKNNWEQRANDYDIYILQQQLKLEQNSRAEEHKKRLEEYRLQQEFLGRNLSSNAAKLAALSQRTLDEYLDSERKLDIRDIPTILNSAAKIAEVGKNLQSGALGVEQLLVALEETDYDE